MSTQNPQPDNQERLIRGAGSVVAYYRLAKAIMFSLIWTAVMLLFWSQGFPYYFVLPALIVPVVILALEIKSLLRFKRLDLSAPQPKERVAADQHEKLVGTVTNLMTVGARGGGASLGTGAVRATENALIITDKNIYAVTVPLAGAGKIVAGQDVSMWKWMLGGKQIREKMDGITDGKSMQEILDSVIVNRTQPRDSTLKIEFAEERRTLIINPLSRNPMQYAILVKEEYEKAKTLLNV